MELINNLLDGFNEMVIKVWPILEAASIRGIPIDETERLKLQADLNIDRRRIYEEIQTKVSDEIRNIYPKNGYVRTPPRVQELVELYNSRIESVKENAENSRSGKRIATLTEFVARKSYHQIHKAGEPTKIWARYRYGNFSVVGKDGNNYIWERWCRVDDFNPTSPKQIIKYMKFKGHKVPVKFNGDETSEAKELERLAISTKDILYDGIIEYRQINKMLTNDIPNWKPRDETRAVHTEFGFYTATGQINSRRPNVQNANKHKPLGKRFRRIVRARDYRDRGFTAGLGGAGGRRRVLVEVDYSGFHAIMLGREAQSERYINISKCDAHSWFTSYVIGKPVDYPSDFSTNLGARERFISRLKEVKKEYKVIRDTQSKPTILGVGLGLQPRKMYWMNRERYDKKLKMLVGMRDEATSRRLQGILKELLPELFGYQDRQKDKAFRQTYLINKWGMIRWFFDVRGEDGEAAIAFDVQGNSHGMLRWAIRRLNEEVLYESDGRSFELVTRPLDYISCRNGNDRDINDGSSGVSGIVSANERYHFINTIHDSLIFEPWEDELDLCVRNVTRVMETACMVLADKVVCPQGLIVRTEATYGDNWAEYDEVGNPGGMKVWMHS